MKLSKRPYTGIVAFVIVLFTMPVGHAVMVLNQKILGETYQFVGATALGVAGFVALLLTLRFKTENARTALGLVAGFRIEAVDDGFRERLAGLRLETAHVDSAVEVG